MTIHNFARIAYCDLKAENETRNLALYYSGLLLILLGLMLYGSVSSIDFAIEKNAPKQFERKFLYLFYNLFTTAVELFILARLVFYLIKRCRKQLRITFFIFGGYVVMLILLELIFAQHPIA